MVSYANAACKQNFLMLTFHWLIVSHSTLLFRHLTGFVQNFTVLTFHRFCPELHCADIYFTGFVQNFIVLTFHWFRPELHCTDIYFTGFMQLS